MLSRLSFRSAFVFSINSLILLAIHLTCFNSLESSLSAYSWLYTLVCAVVQKRHEMSFICNCSHFQYSFYNQTVLFEQLENVNKQWKKKFGTKKFGNEKIWESSKQKLLGLDLDRNLNFNEHVSSLCRKMGNKLSVLARQSNFMSFKQRRILLKTFIEFQFGYCPLIWKFHSRRVNNKINHLHEG